MQLGSGSTLDQTLEVKPRPQFSSYPHEKRRRHETKRTRNDEIRTRKNIVLHIAGCCFKMWPIAFIDLGVEIVHLGCQNRGVLQLSVDGKLIQNVVDIACALLSRLFYSEVI